MANSSSTTSALAGVKRTSKAGALRGAQATAAVDLPAVTNSFELQRILALPRRVLDLSQAPDLTPYCSKSGEMKLWAIQSVCLLEAELYDGLLGDIGVGEGKTLITLLLPEAMNSQHAVLLVPSSLAKKTKREIDEIYSKHFVLPLDRLSIVTYEQLSSQKDYDILERLDAERPIDLIILDEAHWLKNKKSARGGRFLDFVDDRPHIRGAALSGTITSRKPSEAGHIAEFVLKKNSPWPRGYRELEAWDGAIGVNPKQPAAPGALMLFCNDDEPVRSGFCRRVNETPGVVSYSSEDCPASLYVEKLNIRIPERIAKLMKQVTKTWSLEGYEFDSPSTRTQVLRQIACGFYYRWKWPGGVPDYEWLEARCAWNMAVRDKLKHSKPGMDTAGFLFNAAKRWHQGKRTGSVWDCPEWEAWNAVRDRYPREPPRETVWLDDFLVNDAIRRARESVADGSPTIIWFSHRAVGKRLGEITGLPVYGQGTDADGVQIPILIASATVQREGKNLQFYTNSIFTHCPSKGDILQQLIGRTHRNGQTADEVWQRFYMHTPECLAALAKCVEDSTYKFETTARKHKILKATMV